jgi:hypothetical protein
MRGWLTVLDFEATELNNPRAIEIGLLAIDENFNEVGRYESVIKPPVQVRQQIRGLTRLSKNQIDKAPTFKDLWPDIHPFISNRVVVAHNSSYDIKVLYKEFFTLQLEDFLPPSLCTYQWSKKTYPNLPKHTLEYMSNNFNISNEFAHSALGDVLTTHQLLKELIKANLDLAKKISQIQGEIFALQAPHYEARQALVRNRNYAEDADLDEIIGDLTKIGKTDVVITGTPAIGKEGMGEQLKSVGLNWLESPVVKKVAFVIRANQGSGNSKIERAKELGIPVISEDDAITLISKLKALGFK